ncbi:hypothetical protein [uncultured Methanobrevibacter sp.]|uniref:hypothetical protein n=1 Tax=uncultured Methanobrevibacter sp. TaxID=253161 RepID=UPI00261477E7
MFDNKGFLSMMDGILAVFLLVLVLISFNMIMDMEVPSLREENNQFNAAQDIMESMSSKIDAKDYSLLEKVSFTLSSLNNSISSQRKAKAIVSDYFENFIESKGNYKDYKYVLLETNQLDNVELYSTGDYSSASEVSVAIRNCGNYSYKLYIFQD